MGEGCRLARFGGDEFTVLVEHVAHQRQVTTLAERILASLRAPFTVRGREVFISASVGIALGAGGEHGADDLLSFADIAMFQAKEAGKDRYTVFDAGHEAQAMARLEMETALRRAFVREELEVYFQPVVSLDDGHVHGAEALLRWNHPTLGLVGPGQFIGLAEETGLIVPLGRWVLEVACRRAREWQDHRPDGPPLVVTVNLSGRQLQHPDLREQVIQALADSGLDAACLCLEITESVLMTDADDTISTLEGLKRLGVHLAIDDFGTGYSSLSYLKRLPVDVVKLDQSFVAGMDESPVDAEIVAAVVKLTRTAGMQMVAEGVETMEQLEDVRSLGCSLVQGYLLSRPQPNEALVRMLDERWVAAPGLVVLPASV
jgi:predicted signal transduction protein with EAL and GGDEF domain